jgi:hypothetical protein
MFHETSPRVLQSDAFEYFYKNIPKPLTSALPTLPISNDHKVSYVHSISPIYPGNKGADKKNLHRKKGTFDEGP